MKESRSKKSPASAAKADSRQAHLPLAEESPPVAPPPAASRETPTPAAGPPTPPAPLGERAARYNRHRSPLDDRPLAEQAVAPATPPRAWVPARPHAQLRGRADATQPEAPAEPRHKPLDMAAIAERNRAMRQAQRDEKPVDPPPLRQRPQRPLTTESRPQPSTRDESMSARSARHNKLLREDGERPERRTPQLAAKPSLPVNGTVAPPMVARAADATRRRRQALGGPRPAALPDAAPAPALLLPSTAFVWVSRNHGAQLVERVRAWRSLLDAADVRWWLLDLGSVDESVADAEAQHLKVVTAPGGLVTPMATLTAVLHRVDADVVVLADAEALPDRAVLTAIADVRGGRTVVALPREAPTVLAISREAWRRDGFGAAPDLATWSKRRLPGTAPWAQPSGGLVSRLLHAPRLEVAAGAWLPQLRRWLGVVRRA